MTALHLAAKYGHLDVLDVLKPKLELGTYSTKSGYTALHVAAHYGQTNAVRELLQKVPAGKGSLAGDPLENRSTGLQPEVPQLRL